MRAGDKQSGERVFRNYSRISLVSGYCDQLIHIRLPEYNISNLAQPTGEALLSCTDALAVESWLKITTMSGNPWDVCGKPIVCLPIMEIETQLLGQLPMMDNNQVATEAIIHLITNYIQFNYL